MAEVIYFVALPFVATDDGVAAGEPIDDLFADCAAEATG
jgi:hypothetical protein